MFDITSEEVLRYIPDYKINLIAPAEMTDEEINQFQTDFREVMLFVKYSKDKKYLKKLVSEDTHFVHKAWADASDTIKKIKYPMLGDPTGILARFFGVLVEDAGQALRGSFIVSPQGEIKAYEIHDMGIGRDANELLRKVQAAQYVAEHGGEVCPAKWKPGSKTLKPGIDLVGKI